jgi:hypothetical protein
MSALGRALVKAWGGGPKSTYTAKSPTAQFKQMFATQVGYDALAESGLDVTLPTIRNWINDESKPNRENSEKIQAAYDKLAGKWDQANERRPMSIKGRIDSGDRTANRTLKVENPGAGNWERIEDAYNRGADPQEIEDLFADDVLDEVLPTSQGFDFPGGNYEVVIA